MRQDKPEWLITFLAYDNKWYDAHLSTTPNDVNAIPMHCQIKSILKALKELDDNINVKIVFVLCEVNPAADSAKVWAQEKVGKEMDCFDLDILPAKLTVMTDFQSTACILTAVKKRHSAKRNIVITIGHGSVFGINFYNASVGPNSVNGLKTHGVRQSYPLLKEQTDFLNNKFLKDNICDFKFTVAPIEIKLLDEKRAKFLKSNKKDLLEPDVDFFLLTNQELSAAIRAAYGDNGVDILVMDNCLMQNVFTVSDFAGCIKYLVAPISGITYPGFNYVGVINELCKNPLLNSRYFARLFVSDKMVVSHEEYNIFKNVIDNTWFLGCTKLSETSVLDKTSMVFDELCLILEGNKQDIKEKLLYVIEGVRQDMFDYSIYSGVDFYPMVDVFAFCNLLRKRLSFHPQLENKIKNVLKALELVALDRNVWDISYFKGVNFYNPNDNNEYSDQNIQEVLGLVILFPQKVPNRAIVKLLFDMDGKVSYAPGFVKSTKYVKVIKAFLKLLFEGIVE